MTERDHFIAALQIEDPAGRCAYLEDACGGDTELRLRVEALLEVFAQAGSFLQQPASPATLDSPPSVSSPRRASSEQPGAVIGPYKLLQQIGEGGMGSVWMAEQMQPVQRKVAIKVIKPGTDSSHVIARFEAERQALALMDHVNIARVFDAGATESGRPYFVMELVHGVSITKYCDDNHLTPRERLELFVPVCQAIQHAHQKGIIHRDIKPSNVMVTLYDGKPVPKVIDFGVAKATEQNLTERTLFTQYGSMVGTLEYMSPEQAEMSALGVDTRSDIYSLGVLLYELLTGSTPLGNQCVREAAYAEILRMIKEDEPPRPSTRLSDSGEALASISALRGTEPAKLSKLVRGELDWIVMKTLEKDRNRRYETAKGFAADVLRYLNDEPVQACPPSASYRFRKFARRNRSALATVSVLLVTLAIGTGVSTWQAIRAMEANGLAQDELLAKTAAQEATLKQLDLTELAEDQATRRLYHAQLAQARAGSLSRRIGQRFVGLESIVEAAKIARKLKFPEEKFADLRKVAIDCLVLPDMRIAKEWPGWPVGSKGVTFDGSLERYARVDLQNCVSVRRVADDSELWSLPSLGKNNAWPATLSPDGQYLVQWNLVQKYRLWKLGDEKPILEGDLYEFAFSQDSRQFARSLADGSVVLHDLTTSQEARVMTPGPIVRKMAFHPREKRLAVCTPAGVQIIDLAQGAILSKLPELAGAVGLAWHPDGRTLAIDGGDKVIHLWDVAAGKIVRRLEGHTSQGLAFAFNHAGDLLASSSWDSTLRLWDPRTGQQLFKTQAATSFLRFSPDDRLLAVGVHEDNLQFWEVAPSLGFRSLVRDPALGKGQYFTSAIHPKGRLLAVSMSNRIDFWDLARDHWLGTVPLPWGNFHLLFSPSGELLTNGPEGLRAWPVKGAPKAAELLRLGPPRKLPWQGSDGQIAQSRDGKLLAIAQGDGGLALRRDEPGESSRFRDHKDVRYISASPDGLLVATGSHNGARVKIWEAATGKLLKELPIEQGSRVAFSPNGKWLQTNGDGCRLWRVDDWSEGPKLGGLGGVFSPDSRLLAVETGSGTVRLVDPETGKEFARLENPSAEQDRAAHMCFTPDGTQLIATSTDSTSVHIWDLRILRLELAKLGLDWGHPGYEPAPLARNPVALRLRLILGDMEPRVPGAKDWWTIP